MALNLLEQLKKKISGLKKETQKEYKETW